MQINIRQFRENDAQQFLEAVSESVEHLSKWLPWCTPEYSLKEALQWTTSAANTWNEGSDYRFIIEDSETLDILGSVAINQVIPEHKTANLGYWVRKSAINQGVCTQAARLAAKFAFDKLDFQRIEVQVLIDNEASNAVAAKLGGEYEGVFRNKLFFQGKSMPAKCYSIIPSDYEN